jgi:hypothetical protein
MLMKPLPAALVLIASCAAPPAFHEPATVRMKRDVRFLASDEMRGRDNGTPEGERASAYVAERMRDAGLKPAGDAGGWFQTFSRGRNVIGALPGISDSWIVIGAHHDHLGVRKGRVFNGADDNASGVAVLLEMARRLENEPRHHGLLFCSFDAEEDGLVGSNHFVASGLYPVSSFAAMICFDLVGGSFLPGDERRLFALGSESSAELFDWIGRARSGGPLDVDRVGLYVIEPFGPIGARSDYSPFRLKKVPFVFFSTGTPWYYHTPEDDVARLDFRKMDEVSDLASRLATYLACAPVRPSWRDPAPVLREDAMLLFSACKRVVEKAEIRATDRQRTRAAELMLELQKIGEAAEAPSGARQTVQRAMMLLFAVAAAQEPIH